MKISACMIMKNEEKNIKRCIDSYKDIVDEIIVVDTGSTDRSVEIAEKLGAKVYFFDWIDDFAAAKNYAISKANGEWIIFLDADEFFGEETSKNIPSIIERYKKENIDVIMCKMYNIDSGTNEVLNEIIQGRLFLNNDKTSYKGKIHESLISSAGELKPILVNEKEMHIYHTGYSTDIKAEKSYRNIKLLLEQLKEKNFNIEVYYHLSRAYSAIENYEESIKFAQKYIGIRDIPKDKERSIYYTLITDMMSNKNSAELIEKTINIAIAKEKQDAMPYMLLGQYCYENARYQEAIDSFEVTLQLNQKHSLQNLNFVESRRIDIYILLGNLYEIKGDFEKAQHYYQLALKLDAHNDVALLNWLKIIKIKETGSIVSIDEIYENSELEQVLYIVHRAAYFKIEYLLEKYNEVLKKKYEYNDFSLVILMVIQKEYIEASEHLLEAYRVTENIEYLLLIWLSGYISNDSTLMLQSEQLMEKANQECLKNFKQMQMISLKKEQFDSIWKLIEQFYYLDKEKFKALIKWINLISELNSDFKKWLYIKIRVEKHFWIVDGLVNIDENELEGIFILAINAYLDKEYLRAKLYFEKLILNNFQENASKNYLGWINLALENYLNDENNRIKLIQQIQNLVENKELENAEPLIEEYVNDYGKDIEYYSIRSVIEINIDAYDSAIIMIKKGLSLEPTNFDLNYNAGYVYGLIGQRELAIKYMLKAKDNCNDEELRKQIEEYIAKNQSEY